jgi:hypothetical protein
MRNNFQVLTSNEKLSHERTETLVDQSESFVFDRGQPVACEKCQNCESRMEDFYEILFTHLDAITHSSLKVTLSDFLCISPERSVTSVIRNSVIRVLLIGI